MSEYSECLAETAGSGQFFSSQRHTNEFVSTLATEFIFKNYAVCYVL